MTRQARKLVGALLGEGDSSDWEIAPGVGDNAAWNIVKKANHKASQRSPRKKKIVVPLTDEEHDFCHELAERRGWTLGVLVARAIATIGRSDGMTYPGSDAWDLPRVNREK